MATAIGADVEHHLRRARPPRLVPEALDQRRPAHPSTTVSGGVSSTMPNSTNRNVSDRVPVMPGTLIRMPEEQIATIRKPPNLSRSGDSQVDRAATSDTRSRDAVVSSDIVRAPSPAADRERSAHWTAWTRSCMLRTHMSRLTRYIVSGNLESHERDRMALRAARVLRQTVSIVGVSLAGVLGCLTEAYYRNNAGEIEV